MSNQLNKLLENYWFTNTVKLLMHAFHAKLIFVTFRANSTNHNYIEQLKVTNLGTLMCGRICGHL